MNGRMKISVGECEYLLGKDDIFYLPPGVLYDTYTEYDEVDVLNIAFSFFNSGIGRSRDRSLLHSSYLFRADLWDMVESVSFTDEPLFNNPMHQHLGAGMSYLTKTLMNEYTSLEKLTYLYLNTLLKELLIKIARHGEGNMKSAANKKVDEVLKYIKNNVTSLINCESVAKHFCYHPNYLNRLIKEHCGCTLRDCIADIKINAAMRLLIESNSSVTYIAHYLSFYDSSHFNHVFIGRVGITPSEYRRAFSLIV